jgi:outer membrane receptor protein involved in Fe transport
VDFAIPPASDVQIPSVPREQIYDTPFDFSDQEVLRFQIDFETQLSKNFTLRNKAYHRDLDWQSAGTLPLFPAFAVAGGNVTRIITELDDQQKLTGNQLELVVKFETGRVSHQFLAGVEFSRLEDDFALSSGQLPDINAFNPVETATGIVAFPFIVGDSTSEVYAPYVTDQIKFSEKFQLLLGGRYDKIETSANFATNFQELPLHGNGYTTTDTEFSPRAGLVFSPRPDLTLYANAAESFAPIGPRTRGARSLEPEKSQQIEVGAKKRFLSGKLQTSVAVFKLDRERIPITDATGFTQQEGDQEAEGIEFELAAEPIPRLRTFFSYAYTDAELTRFTEVDLFGTEQNRSGNDPAFVPEHLANLWVSKSFANGLGVGGGVRYVAEQFIDEDNAFKIDAYTTVDAALFYDFDAIRLKLNVKNLTDEDYETRGFGAASVIPADPLTVHASFEWRR